MTAVLLSSAALMAGTEARMRVSSVMLRFSSSGTLKSLRMITRFAEVVDPGSFDKVNVEELMKAAPDLVLVGVSSKKGNRGAQRGTDLDHGSRIHCLGQYGEGGGHTLTDRGEPGLNRLHPGLLKTIGDGGVGLGEAPALRRRRRDGRISYVSHTATLPSSMPLSVEALS